MGPAEAVEYQDPTDQTPVIEIKGAERRHDTHFRANNLAFTHSCEHDTPDATPVDIQAVPDTTNVDTVAQITDCLAKTLTLDLRHGPSVSLANCRFDEIVIQPPTEKGTKAEITICTDTRIPVMHVQGKHPTAIPSIAPFAFLADPLHIIASHKKLVLQRGEGDPTTIPFSKS